MTKFGNVVSIELLDQVGMIALAESLKYTPYRKLKQYNEPVSAICKVRYYYPNLLFELQYFSLYLR